MARVLSVNVSPGGVPTPQVAFGRARVSPEGRTIFEGYLFGATESHFTTIRGSREAGPKELEELGLDKVNIADFGGKRERSFIIITNTREDTRIKDQTGQPNHDSDDQRMCIFPFERYLELQDMGHMVSVGSLGENITTLGLNQTGIREGMLISIGERNKRGMVLKASRPRKPCITIEAFAVVANAIDNRSEGHKLNLIKAIGYTIEPEDAKFGGSGWYCSIHDVWGNGVVKVPDKIELVTNV